MDSRPNESREFLCVIKKIPQISVKMQKYVKDRKNLSSKE